MKRKPYKKFKKFLENKEIDFFYGSFGEKYENKTYYGFYPFNETERKMMFFQKDTKDNDGNQTYVLHSYMKLSKRKADKLAFDHALLN